MSEILSNIQAAALAMTWQEIGATIFSIIYVILAAKENIWCWFFGLIGTVLSLWVYVNFKLYSDASLQVFYIGMSIYGWMTWRQKGNISATKLPITALKIKTHFLLFIVGTALAILLGFFWQSFGAVLPFIDAFTTSFSIIATFLVAKKILENWIYWIVIDFACIFIYFNRGMYLFSLLFFVYFIIAIFAYLAWKKEYKTASLR